MLFDIYLLANVLNSLKKLLYLALMWRTHYCYFHILDRKNEVYIDNLSKIIEPVSDHWLQDTSESTVTLRLDGLVWDDVGGYIN